MFYTKIRLFTRIHSTKSSIYLYIRWLDRKVNNRNNMYDKNKNKKFTPSPPPSSASYSQNIRQRKLAILYASISLSVKVVKMVL